MRFKALSSNVWLILNHPLQEKIPLFSCRNKTRRRGDRPKCVPLFAIRSVRLMALEFSKGLHFNSGRTDFSFATRPGKFFVEPIRVSIPRDRRHGASSSSAGSNQNFQTASENSGDTKRGFWADPPRLSPRPNWLEIWCQIGVKDRRFGRFCRLSRLVTTYPSTTYVFRLSMAWKRSSVRSRSGPPTNPLQLMFERAREISHLVSVVVRAGGDICEENCGLCSGAPKRLAAIW